MGGQACVFYGAAEFSRDLDLLILTEPGNLERTRLALAALEARAIAVPPFDIGPLRRGHASHFRCQRPDVAGLRIDLMASLRGVADFETLWTRRTSIEAVDLLALPDLVQAKKTQQDKDWPMIRRLVERSYLTRDEAGPEFWLRELRTPSLLIEAAAQYRTIAETVAGTRAAAKAALTGDEAAVESALEEEEREERRRDREYWAPLKRELEQFRLLHSKNKPYGEAES
jgi:hypothetical protein